MLTRGTQAPEFEADCVDGRHFSLTDQGGKLLWLIFYRYTGCPICNLHLSTVKRRAEWLQKHGIQVVAVYDSPESAFPKEMKTPDFKLPILNIADPDRTIFQLYETELSTPGLLHWKTLTSFVNAATKGFFQGPVSGSLRQMPAHFLLTQEGVIDIRYYGKHAGDHLPPEALEVFVKRNEISSWGPGDTVVL